MILLIGVAVLSVAILVLAVRDQFPWGTNILIASGFALAVMVSAAIVLTLRYRNFTVGPGEITAVHRRERPLRYRLDLITGKRRTIVLTSAHDGTGTMEQLIPALEGAMLSAGAPGVPTGTPATDGWKQISRADALRELRGCANVELDAAQPTEDDPVAGFATIPVSQLAAAQSGYPTPELVQQWNEDDEYAEEALRQRQPRRGTFSGLRWITWAVLAGSLYFLANEHAHQTATVFSLWGVAFALVPWRGSLLDRRATEIRSTARGLFADHPQLQDRGMPRPWLDAARYYPDGAWCALRSTLGLLFWFVLIGLPVSIEETNRTATIVLGTSQVVFVVAIIAIWRVISRRQAQALDNVRKFGGHRAQWQERFEE